jgi:PIN like domain
VTFFFDNTFPPQLAKILVILGVDARHLQDDFPPDTLDVDWIPEVGKRGWVVVTGDRRISKKPPERKALQEANVIAVFMSKGFTSKKIFDIVASFVKWWPEIEYAVSRVKPGTSLEVGVNGKVEVIG